MMVVRLGQCEGRVGVLRCPGCRGLQGASRGLRKERTVPPKVSLPQRLVLTGFAFVAARTILGFLWDAVGLVLSPFVK